MINLFLVKSSFDIIFFLLLRSERVRMYWYLRGTQERGFWRSRACYIQLLDLFHGRAARGPLKSLLSSSIIKGRAETFLSTSWRMLRLEPWGVSIKLEQQTSSKHVSMRQQVWRDLRLSSEPHVKFLKTGYSHHFKVWNRTNRVWLE